MLMSKIHRKDDFSNGRCQKKSSYWRDVPLPPHRTGGAAAQRKLRVFFCAEKGFLRKRKGHSGGIAAAECLRRAAGPCAGGAISAERTLLSLIGVLDQLMYDRANFFCFFFCQAHIFDHASLQEDDSAGPAV